MFGINEQKIITITLIAFFLAIFCEGEKIFQSANKVFFSKYFLNMRIAEKQAEMKWINIFFWIC